MSKIAACVFALLLWFVPTAAAQGPDLSALDARFAQALADWNVPGMSIAIVKDGKVVLAKGYGVREMGKPDTVDADTLFAIASNSKAFTSTLIGMLVDGLFSSASRRMRERRGLAT